MSKNFFETIVGAIVIAVAAFFLFFALKHSGKADSGGYALNATFERVDGLSKGSDVRMSGLKVGTVSDITINPKTYQAMTILSLEDSLQIPKDSSAEILGDSLLGGKYVAIVPGGSPDVFAKGDTIRFTQSSVSIEALLGKFMFGGNDSADSEGDEDDIF